MTDQPPAQAQAAQPSPAGQGQELRIERIPTVAPLDADRPIWTRQTGETPQEWAWFQLYRGMHPAKRSLRGAYVKYRQAKGETWEIRHAPPQLVRMSKQWSWQKRAAEFDVYVDREKNIAIAQAREEAIQGTLELGQNMRKAAAIAVQALFEDLYEEQIDPATGQTITVFKNKLSPNAIVRLAKAGVELERLALGMGDGRSPSSSTTVNVIAGVVSGGGVRRTDDALLVEAAEILEMRKLQAQVIEGEYDEK